MKAERLKILKLDVLFSYGLFVTYCGIIFYTSSQSFPPGTLPEFNDKTIHFLEYGLLGILTLNALMRSFHSRSARFLILWAWGFATFYGLTDEIHQSFVPQRFMEVGDFIADSFGAFWGICLFFGLRKSWRDRLDKASLKKVSYRKD